MNVYRHAGLHMEYLMIRGSHLDFFKGVTSLLLVYFHESLRHLNIGVAVFFSFIRKTYG